MSLGLAIVEIRLRYTGSSFIRQIYMIKINDRGGVQSQERLLLCQEKQNEIEEAQAKIAVFKAIAEVNCRRRKAIEAVPNTYHL